jgi:hypothetical protein
MGNSWKGRKKEHQWNYMGWDKEKKVEYAFCELCGKYKTHKDEPITKKEYLSRYNTGMIEGL